MTYVQETLAPSHQSERYTKESLLFLNHSYHSKHILTQEDVDKVNFFKAMIEATRTKTYPQVGDIIEYTDKRGRFFPGAHVETKLRGELNICEKPYEPFVSAVYRETLHTTTSGGSWLKIPTELKYVGSQNKIFVIWGHKGACGDGAVRFEAEVSVWEHNVSETDFTTKTHDRFSYTLYTEQEQSSCRPFAVINGDDNLTRHSFDSNQELQLWLKTFDGTLVPVSDLIGTSGSVWTPKLKKECVPVGEYLQIDAHCLDTQRFNGYVQQCKRIREGHTLTTYYPYQADAIKLPEANEYEWAQNQLGMFVPPLTI